MVFNLLGHCERKIMLQLYILIWYTLWYILAEKLTQKLYMYISSFVYSTCQCQIIGLGQNGRGKKWEGSNQQGK